MDLSVQLQNGTIGYTYTTSSDSGGTTTDVFGPIILRALWSYGTAANQANLAYRDYQVRSTAKTYTLSALPGGIALAKNKLLFVQVLTTNTVANATLAIAPGGTHGWAGATIGVPLVAGSILLVTWPTLAGAAVVASTTDQITFTPAGGNVEYVAAFVGTDA
jgi:hypothetical protein